MPRNDFPIRFDLIVYDTGNVNPNCFVDRLDVSLDIFISSAMPRFFVKTVRNSQGFLYKHMILYDLIIVPNTRH